MTLIFQNPLFLYGITASGIPVLIHLINRRRAKPRRFPSITLIMESHQKVARHHRIKQILLLALRVLSIASIAFFLAGPRLVTNAEGGAGRVKESKAVIIIVDNSFSMNYRTDRGKYIDRAKALAGELLEKLNTSARVAVVPLIPEEDRPWMLTPDLNAAKQALSRISISYGQSNVATALSKAYSTLNDLPPEYGRMILLITDMTRTPWDGFSAAKLDILNKDVKLKIVGLGDSEKSPNGYIKNISFGRATVGTPLPIEAELQNPASIQGKDLQAELEVSGETVQRRFLKASPGESSRVRFEYAARSPGLLEAELRISEDRLADDDVYYFIIPVRDKIDVLVVDGDPKTSLLQSEVYYLTNALQPGPDEEQSPISPKVVTISRFESMDRYEADAIVLANVDKIDREARLRLMDYVVGGGSLVFYLGGKVDPDDYNKIFYDSATRLLPVRLKEVQEAPARLWRIDHIDLTHPALESFQGREGESLLRAQFNKAFQVEQGTAGDAKVLLALDNGMPLLMEKKIGRGKVLLFTSTADRDWNDLCVRGAYLPLIQALIGYVTTENFQLSPAAGRAGQPVSIPLKETVAETTVEVKGPDKSIITGIVSREGGKAVLDFEGRAPGIYRAGVGRENLKLALNTSKEESDLTHITEAELKGKFDGAEIDVITGAVNAAGILRERGKTVMLSSALALMMFLFLAAEGVIANKT